MPGVNPALILTLARDNKADDIQKVVNEMGADVTWGNTIGQTALHIASLHGNLEAMRMLLSLGADPNQQNDMGQVPLHFAAHANKNTFEACTILLDADGDPFVPDQRGTLPFENAQQDEIRELLGGPNTAIFTLSAEGDLAGLQEFFKEDPEAEASPISADGMSPLHLATRGGHFEVVKFLLSKGADLLQHESSQGDTPLHLAVRDQHVDIAKYLIQHDVSGDLINTRNFHPSTYASGSWISNGKALGPFHQTALHVAVEESDADVAKLLLDLGAKPDVLDFDKRTALHYALEIQDEELAEILLEHGADPNLGCNDFTSPLHVASQQGATSLIKLLVKSGADLAISDEDGWSPLHLAARAGKIGAVKELIAAGASVSAVNSSGNAAIHLAAANGRTEICKVLLSAPGGRAASLLKNKDGKVAEDIAKNPETKEVFKS